MVEGATRTKQVVLLIEDNEFMRKITASHLQDADFLVCTATNGKEGITLARQEKPAVVLCDLRLPDIDGYAVLRALRADRSTALTPFIFLTSDQDLSARRKGMELGADDFLTKPIHYKDLLFAIHAQLTKYKHMFKVYTEQKEKLHAAQQQLSLMVAHELRTPIASLMMAHELMSWRLESLSSEQMLELLNTMDAGIRRLRHLSEQMVLLTQLETGVLVESSIRRNGALMGTWTLITAAIDLAREFDYRKKGVAVTMDERDRFGMVMCNPGSLKHALAELINNAIVFSPPAGEVRIAQWQEDGTAWVSITDQGPGIPPDKLEAVQRSFEQVEREKQEQQGMGMGLPLAKGIISAHGGKLLINSRLENGTQVLVGLPLA